MHLWCNHYWKLYLLKTFLITPTDFLPLLIDIYKPDPILLNQFVYSEECNFSSPEMLYKKNTRLESLMSSHPCDPTKTV